MANNTSVLETQVVEQRSPGSYSEYDTIPFKPLSFSEATIAQLVKLTGINKKSATILAEFRKKYKTLPVHEVPFHLVFDQENANQLKRCLLFQDDKRTVIENVEIVGGKIMSESKFSLRVSFAGDISNAPLLVSVQVNWKGLPFTVEKIISKDASKKGYADIAFDADQTLPVGLAMFYVSLYNSNGSLSSFRLSAYTLPSNPFSLDLSPRSNFVTGTFSARAVKQGGSYHTSVGVTLSNGNNFAVNMKSAFTWKFWDGGVGGSLVESGTGNFNTTIKVPASGTWGG